MKQGFTIIELLIVVFVSTLIISAAFTLEKDSMFLNRIISVGMAAQNDARSALKTMSSEIRTMSPSSLGSYPIDQAATSSLVFYANIDGSTLKERIRYFLDGHVLKRGTILPSGNPLVYNANNEKFTVLVKDVTNGATPIFSYFDQNYDGTGAALANPVTVSSIRLVKINVVMDVDGQGGSVPMTLATQVSPRNIKDNL
jgi:prepilin-type N-terminal cleavage/methylation domain-containing protein